MASASDRFYQLASTTFCVIVVLSNIISAKLCYLPYLADSIFPAGLITYPLTFLISDLVTELYGSRKAKNMVYMALGMAILSNFIIQMALILPSTDMMNRNAFQTVMGLNSLVMSASLIAYVVGQIIDIQLYAWIKQMTGPDLLWLRNNGSTLVSQMVDTIIVNLIHLYWGLGIELSIVLKMMLFSYVYKAIFSIINTPIFYGCVFLAKHRVPNKMLIN